MSFVKHQPASASWVVDTPWTLARSAKNMLLGTGRLGGAELVELAMNGVEPTVYDADFGGKRVVNPMETLAAREKQAALKEMFAKWLFADDGRAKEMLALYNRQFNSVVQRQYDGEHLNLPGYTWYKSLDEHQKSAIWRIVSGGKNTLLGHPVGAGKTLVMVCAGMELRRLGRAKKPMYVVPNHMLEQFSFEFLEAYPAARIMVPQPDDVTPAKRAEFIARVATNDWDAVIVTHSMFSSIDVDPDHMREFIGRELAEIDAAMEGAKASSNKNNRSVKDLARLRKDWAARMEKLTPKGDSFMGFEQMGIDYLFVDEAHLFKNLVRHSRMGRIAGLSNANSARSFDLLVKSRQIIEKHGDGRCVFATATFVANSMAEMWVMQKFLQPETLKKKGIYQFDAWAANFGEAVTAMELAPDGMNYRLNRRFAKFVNLPELIGVFGEVADTKTVEELNIPRPQAIRETVSIEPTADLVDYVKSLVRRVEAIRGMSPKEDNMLKVTSDGRKAALDMRMVSPLSPVEDGKNKIVACAQKVWSHMKQSEAIKGSQIVFCDMGTPGGSGFNAYAALRDELVRLGANASEVAFIHDYDTPQKKGEVFRAVKSGLVRVLVGSTEKMGVGTNVQERLVALHHLDAPWRPADIEQREGRILRRGNTNARAYIYRYVTQGSFDAYIWQTLESKARFIAQVMARNPARSAEDAEMAALSYAEVKALASGNPLVLEKAKVDADVARLSAIHTSWKHQQWEIETQVKELPDRIAAAKNRAKALGDAALRLNRDCKILIGGKEVVDDREAANMLLDASRKMEKSLTRIAVGTVGGYEAALVRQAGLVVVTVRAEGRDIDLGVAKSGSAAVACLKDVKPTLMAMLERCTTRMDQDQNSLVELQKRVNTPFPQEAALKTAVDRQKAIYAELGGFDSVLAEAGDKED